MAPEPENDHAAKVGIDVTTMNADPRGMLLDG
jgi:hypothetical protein